MKAMKPLLSAILLATVVGAHAQGATADKAISSQAAPATSAAAVNTPIDDRAFAKAAARDGMAEIAMAKMAQEKASSADVKQYAQELMAAHTDSNKQLTEIAKDNGIKLPKKIAKDDKQVKDELAKLSGSQFDRRFIQAQIVDHQKAIDLFQRAANSAKSTELKEYARSTLPHLQAHLDKAKQLAAQMGTSSR